jgi:DNA gyrase subunit B
MDRSMRALRRVRVEDAANAERVFELLMGNDVAPRRDFIVDAADSFEREKIDA